MTDKLRWGILGTGGIAVKFVEDLRYLPDAEVVAVGSRAQETADAFGNKYNIPRRYPTYEALAADPEVDAIYVSTPHPYHEANALLCIDNGKAVLCEKPFTINAGGTERVINRAREKGVFLMEAMWTRYIPTIVKMRELIASGAIGEVRAFRADFGFHAPFDPKGRLFDPELGGGALLDVGIYPISFSYMVLGAPQTIASTAYLGATGVDEQNGILFGYEGGKTAVLSSAVSLTTQHDAIIMGTKGRIIVQSPFWQSRQLTLIREGLPAEVHTIYSFPHDGLGYQFEAAEVAACLRAGKLESDIMPLDESLAIMRTLDTIRAQWGFKYPGE